MTAQDKKALQLAQEAEGHETNGQTMKAVECWRKAFKLSPRVETLFFSDTGEDGNDDDDDDDDNAWFMELSHTRRCLIGTV